jgi:hypothetical protein
MRPGIPERLSPSSFASVRANRSAHPAVGFTSTPRGRKYFTCRRTEFVHPTRSADRVCRSRPSERRLERPSSASRRPPDPLVTPPGLRHDSPANRPRPNLRTLRLLRRTGVAAHFHPVGSLDLHPRRRGITRRLALVRADELGRCQHVPLDRLLQLGADSSSPSSPAAGSRPQPIQCVKTPEGCQNPGSARNPNFDTLQGRKWVQNSRQSWQHEMRDSVPIWDTHASGGGRRRWIRPGQRASPVLGANVSGSLVFVAIT